MKGAPELSASRIVNAMSVDVEDYFQVLALEPYISRADWDSMPRRVESNTSRVLDLFAAHDVKATFFTLAWVAERHPQVVRRIVAAGHELGSHGMAHARVSTLSPRQLYEDASRSRRILEDIGGQPVFGYRAPSYSIGANNLWALDVLADAGYRYSSSIFPIRHDLYGMPEGPRFPFRTQKGSLLEVPVTTVTVFGRRLPCGGGGYFRLLPYGAYRWALRRVNRRDGQPGVFYFHPWEIDPGQPRIAGVGFKSRFRHYVNLAGMQAKIERLLRDFQWNRMDRVFLAQAQEPAAEPVNLATAAARH